MAPSCKVLAFFQFIKQIYGPYTPQCGLILQHPHIKVAQKMLMNLIWQQAKQHQSKIEQTRILLNHFPLLFLHYFILLFHSFFPLILPIFPIVVSGLGMPLHAVVQEFPLLWFWGGIKCGLTNWKLIILLVY